MGCRCCRRSSTLVLSIWWPSLRHHVFRTTIRSYMLVSLRPGRLCRGEITAPCYLSPIVMRAALSHKLVSRASQGVPCTLEMLMIITAGMVSTASTSPLSLPILANIRDAPKMTTVVFHETIGRIFIQNCLLQAKTLLHGTMLDLRTAQASKMIRASGIVVLTLLICLTVMVLVRSVPLVLKILLFPWNFGCFGGGVCVGPMGTDSESNGGGFFGRIGPNGHEAFQC